jgi:hypothetical protein
MSNEKQQTGLDWFITQLQKSKDFQRVINEVNQSSTDVRDVITEAKEMENKQMIDFADDFWFHCVNKDGSMKITPEQYYNETYGGN